jgi:predicted phage terminase large subunit-like protein
MAAQKPTPRQKDFLWLDCLEAFYGGAAGGGKSSALLMAALQLVDIPGYSAIIFRQTYADLALPGALMDRSFEWLLPTDAKWNATEKKWLFPSGATLNFGYLESENDKYRYRSSEFQFIGFDELTNFTETQYRFLFSRLRRTNSINVPLRMRSASNPGGVGHDWVKTRFVGSATAPPEVPGVFIAATLADNPHLNQEEYTKSLMQLDPVTRAQLLAGDWEAYEGGMFQRHWFDLVDAAPADAERCRSWDKAGTVGGGDYSAGVLMSRTPDGIFYIEDVIRGQWGAFERERIIKQTTEADAARYGTRKYSVLLEQEPGSGGKHSAEITIKALVGYTVKAERPTGEKEARARPLASQAEAGNVRIVRGAWNRAYIDEICLFPTGSHDDQVDATSGAFNRLALQRKLRLGMY